MAPKLVALDNETNKISIADAALEVVPFYGYDNIATGTDGIFGEMDVMSILHFITTLFYHLL
jgi:hypothetical protein